MRARQSPQQWLIVDSPGDVPPRLPRGSGILLIAHELAPGERRQLARRLRRAARAGGHRMIDEAEPRRRAARVHNMRELRIALLRRTELVLLSPLFPTASHPDWPAIKRMRAAAMAQLARRRLIALGGMNARRFAGIMPLGFRGWAGLRAWRAR